MDPMRALSIAVVLMAAPAVGLAQTSEVFIFLDRAGSSAGCSIDVGTPPTTVSNVDGQIRVTLDQGSGQVSQVAVSTCSGGLLGAEDTSSPAGHAIGVGNGVAGSNVVEFGVDQALLFPAPGIDGGSFTVAAVSGDSVDLVAGGSIISTQAPTPVPTLQSFSIAILAITLGLSAVIVLRRNRGLMVVALIVISASAWAMAIVLDGMTGDWAGVGQTPDPTGDATIGGPYSDVRAVFSTRNGSTVFFRADVADQAPPTLVAVDDSATTNEDSPVAIASVFANDDNPNAGTLTLQSVSTVGLQGLLTNNNDGTFGYDPNGAFESLPAGTNATDSFDYTVSDGTDTSTATVTITVTGVNDAPTIDSMPVTLATADILYTYSVVASDVDNPDTLTLTATTLPAWLTFTDNGGGNGTLEGTPADSDAGNSDVTLMVTDSASASATQSFTIVVAANDPVAADDSFTIDEDSGLNTFDVTANDANPGSATLSIGGVTQGSQGAVGISGTDVTYTPNADACNDGTPADTFTYTLNPGATVATVSVTITCLNDPPVVNDQTFGVAESAMNGTAIGMVVASDVDTSDTLSYAFNPPTSVFGIDATGSITVIDAAQLDFETTPTYNLTVEVTDDGTPVMSDMAAITINVTDDNEPPTIAPQSFMLAENSANMTSVGTVVASDSDAGQTLSYAIMPPSSVFAIDAMSGEITVTDSAALDFETTPMFSLTVVVTDNGGTPLSSMATITINLTDQNDPPVVNDQMFSIDEDAANLAPVGVVVAGDVDAGDSLTFAITAGNVDANLDINTTTGQIFVVNPPGLDFEMTPGYSLTVQVTDTLGPASDTATIMVTVNDVNESPTITTAATASVAENTTAVADIDATDPEGDVEGGGGLTYSITGGADAALFSIDTNSGVLTFISAPDFETPTDANTDNDYEVDVTVTDSGTLTDTLMMTVSVTDANDPPTITTMAAVGVDENTTAVIDIMATDPEGDTEGAGLSYAITGGVDSALFGLNTATGVLTFMSAPDFETPGDSGADNVYNVQVTVTDSGAPNLTDVQDLVITVNDVNEAPTVADESYSVQAHVGIQPMAASGVLVNDSDPDMGDSIQIDPADVGTFATGMGGTITLNADGSFVYSPEANDVGIMDTFTYTVRDSGGLTTTGTVTFNVNSDLIWFVDVDASTGGDGTLSAPFDSLIDLDTTGANPDLDGHRIFHYASGGGMTDALTDDFSLQANQILVGHGVSTGTMTDTINDHLGLTTQMHSRPLPLINASSNLQITGQGIDLATNNAIRGIDIGNTGGHGITGNMFGTVTIDEVAIIGTGPILVLVNGTVAGSGFTTLETTSATGTPVILTSVAGTLGVTGTTSIASVGGITILTSPTLTVNFGGTVSVATTAGSGIRDDNGATLNFTGTMNTINAVGSALELTNTNLGAGATFASATSTNSTNVGIALTGVSGPIAINDGSISGSTNAAFSLNGGSSNVSYAGSITNASASAVSIINRTGGTTTLSGTITDNGPTNGGIQVSNNSGGAQQVFSNTVSVTNSSGTAVNVASNPTGSTSFTSLQINNSASNQPGLVASGNSGVHTLNVTTGSVNAGSNTAISLANTNLGINLVRVDSAGASANAGINVNTTSGFLRIVGDGGGANNGSGGTIANKTVSGAVINNASNIQLDYMNIDDNDGNGVNVTGVNGFMMHRSNIRRNATPGDSNEAGLLLTNLTGSALAGSNPTALSNVVVFGTGEDNVRIRNTTGTLARLMISNSTFGDGTTTNNDDGIDLEASGTAVANITVAGSTFVANRGDHFNTTTLSGGQIDVVFTGNVLSGGNPSPLGQGVTIASGANATTTYEVSGNMINGAVIQAINVNKGDLLSGTMSGTISGNMIGTVGVPGSGSSTGIGIQVIHNGAGTHTAAVTNNQIREWVNGPGIRILARDGGATGGTLNATVTGNTLSNPGTFGYSLLVQSGAAAGDAHTLCADIGGAGALANNFVDNPGAFDGTVTLFQRFATSMNLENYAGGATSDPNLTSYLQGRNNGIVGVQTGDAPYFTGGVTGVGGGTCPTP